MSQPMSWYSTIDYGLASALSSTDRQTEGGRTVWTVGGHHSSHSFIVMADSSRWKNLKVLYSFLRRPCILFNPWTKYMYKYIYATDVELRRIDT